jgi:hypothetical protein
MGFDKFTAHSFTPNRDSHSKIYLRLYAKRAA